MEADATKNSRIAALRDEMEGIHHANTEYWALTDPGRGETAKYHERVVRLEEIRSLFEHLMNSNGSVTESE
jgi:hypothetical protein